MLSSGIAYYAVQDGSNFKPVDAIKPNCVTIQMKAIEQYFYVVLFIMLYKVASNL